MDGEGRLHLTEEFHYGVGRVTIEAVSGGVEPEEPVELAARRELREELGIEAEHWLDLGKVDPFTANVVSPTQLYLATKLTFGTPEPDGGELIRPHVISLADACEAIMESKITHAPSVAAILKAWYLRPTS
jgi:ADP-ribose pyrophosphatase